VLLSTYRSTSMPPKPPWMITFLLATNQGNNTTNPQQSLLTVKMKNNTFPKPPRHPWITADEAPSTVLLSAYTPATTFSDPSGVNTSTALSVFYGVEPTSMPPKPPWTLASRLSTPHSGTWLLQWDPGLLDDSAPHPAWRWERPLSAGDETTDVAEGLTLGVRTCDHCGCAQAVATGGDSPRKPGWTRTGIVYFGLLC
jgi:hypothetical protein